MATRKLILVLGDQLDRQSAAFDGFDPKLDIVWMAEVAGEATHVWSHRARIAIFLAAMRHYRDELLKKGLRVDYSELPAGFESLGDALREAIGRLKPQRLVVVHPGEWRVREELREVAASAGLELEELDDRHFYTTPDDFARYAKGRKQLRLEFFYRELRKRFDVLMEGGQPVGGAWNFDKENRGSFGKKGPGKLPAPRRFKPDKVTREVLDLVNERFTNHPGSLDDFDWPVTPMDAQRALADFIEHRLPLFGEYQDAMWGDEAWLYHSRLSAAMNLKLLDPRDVVNAAVAAYETGHAPLEAVEGFVRQILGWREYVRGIYWHTMPEYLERNALGATEPLPEFYWTGETDMACLRAAIGQTLRYGYAHHIQRLMVTGLFAMMLGVDPRQVHEWYLAVYVDAVEWVELPNTLGMSQHADGGLMASKPYCATGKYLQRMSNHCTGCRYDPAQATGERACPFTTLYWDFLAGHRTKLAGNMRMTMQLKNVDRKKPEELAAIRAQAEALRAVMRGRPQEKEVRG